MKLVVRDEQGQLILTCPTCRQATPVPANGVAGLQSAFHINHLLEIQELLKEAKDPVPTSQEVVKSDEAYPITREVIPNCFEHADKERELYCETCEDLICWKCAIKGGKHHDHDHQPLYEAFEKYKREMTSSLEPMEEKLAAIDEALKQFDKCHEEISNQREVIEANIHNSIGKLFKVLEARKTKLISKLHQITHRKLKNLATQRDQVETIQAQLHSCHHFMKESMKTGIREEVLMMKSNVARQVKELSTAFQPGLLKPNTGADIVYAASIDATVVCQNYGQIYTSDMIDPIKSYAEGKGLENARVREESTVSMVALNEGGEPCTKLLESQLQCELVSEITGVTVRGAFKRSKLNQYEINYQPTLKGRHQLHITVDEQHIKGSPFAVKVKSPVEELGTPITTINGLNRPRGVAVSPSGELIVTENKGHCVSIFSPSGEKLRSFGSLGSGKGQFSSPRGVALDGMGNILVVDNHRIQKYTIDGQFITAVGTEGNGPLQFKYPHGITFNTSNNKVYVVDANNRIQILNSDLTFFSIIGREGNGKGQLLYPSDIACDNTGKVYVADCYNHRIQVFTAEGKFQRMFGRYGQGRGELDKPLGIAVDPKDIIYVSEWKNHRVSVFTSEGQFITSFGTHGKEVGKFNIPIGLAVDNTGVIFVADKDNNRIQVF